MLTAALVQKLQLPLLMLHSIWQRVPRCIREPVENFIKNQILARIPVFGQFSTDPELWPRVQQTALGILRRIVVDGDLAGAAWAFFQAVLRIFNVPAQLVVQILAKAAVAVGAISSIRWFFWATCYAPWGPDSPDFSATSAATC